MRKRFFQWFTFALLILSVVMAYENVISDDSAVRTLAKETVEQAAGCGSSCKISGFRGERGMIHETIEYDLSPQGHYVVQCRRAYVAIGDYACMVTEGTVAPRTAASAPSSFPSSATSR